MAWPGRGSRATAVAVAALLHDVGKLVLAARLPDQFEASLAASVREGRTLGAVEVELTGASHAQVGGYLLARLVYRLECLESLAVEAARVSYVLREVREHLVEDSFVYWGA